MNKIFAILATTVLMLTILTSPVYAEGGGETILSEGSATVNAPPCVPGIEVEKTAWNGTAWVDEIRADVGDIVKFNSTIHNSGTCCDLTNITVTDTLSDSLEYVDATPKPEGVTRYPDGTTELTWFLTGPLAPSETKTFLINATVTKCGIDTNTQHAEAEGCGETVSDEDTATVRVPGVPEIEVEKTVKDPATGNWVKEIEVNVSKLVRFKSTIHNNGTCCDLTNISVTDTLSDSLKYTSAKPTPDEVIHNEDGSTTLKWFLPGPLAPCETETFRIRARVMKCLNGTNTQNATGESCGDIFSDEDTAKVIVVGPINPSMDVNKTVWDGSAWVDDVITVNSSEVVQFKVTIKNAGECCNFTGIDVRDWLSPGFEYVDATPEPDGVTHEPDGSTWLVWWLAPLAPSETVTILINARATALECYPYNHVGGHAEYICVDGSSDDLYDWDWTGVIVVSEPEIEVNKTVWNGTAWVDEITANVSDRVQFNSTIKNTGKCGDLTNITVRDILSDSFDYFDATPEPDGIVEKPDGTTELTWFLPWPLAPNDTETFLIEADIIDCGVDTNTQYAEAESPRGTVSDEDTATVNVPGVPGIEVEKTVWNGSAWVDNITANVSDTVRFNSTIHNNGMCCNLTNITVTDTLSRSLEFLSATPVPDGVTHYLDGTTELTWFLSGPIEPCDTKTFLIDASIAECGVESPPGYYKNIQNATAESCGVTVTDEDSATVNVPVEPDIDVEKTVWNGTAWVKEITASIGDTLKFNSTIHNNGMCCNLTNITVTDTLSDSLNYTSATPAPDTVTHHPDGTTTLTWFLPGPLALSETKTFVIKASVINCGVDYNNQSAMAEGCGISVFDSDSVTVNVPGVPGIEVKKTVLNETGAWVKEITANLSDTVQFNSTVYNTGTCCLLTNITVTDILSDSLEYVNATPAPTKVIYYPDGTTKLIWYPAVFAPYGTQPLPPANSKTFIVNAKVTKCGGVDTNTQYAEAVSCGEVVSDEDTATVYVPGVPGIEVKKTVWNVTTSTWEDEITANVSDTVRFNSTIHNNGTCCNLIDITVTDTLSDSLEYVGVQVGTPEPDDVIHNPDGTTTLKWFFPGPLAPCESMTFLIDANVTKCGVDTNTQTATAEGCGEKVSDEDSATVNVTEPVEPGIDVEKTVLDPDTGEWVDKINASISDTVKFNSTIHNNGTCCNLTNIDVTDTLSDSLEYVGVQGDTPEPDGVIHNPDGTTTLKWFFPGPLAPCETITLLIDAHVTKYGEDWNKQNATADACDGTTVSDEDYAYVNVPTLKPDLVITDKWVCWPDNCTICYNVTNIGDGTAPACHNTTLYVDGVEVAHDHVPVDLAPGGSYIGCFDGYDWGYTPPSDNITVCADNNETLDELDENNNCVTNNIWMCGDVNNDHTVDVVDVLHVYRRALDSGYPLDLPWAADVNCDHNIDVVDVLHVYRRALDPEYDLNCCCE